MRCTHAQQVLYPECGKKEKREGKADQSSVRSQLEVGSERVKVRRDIRARSFGVLSAAVDMVQRCVEQREGARSPARSKLSSSPRHASSAPRQPQFAGTVKLLNFC